MKRKAMIVIAAVVLPGGILIPLYYLARHYWTRKDRPDG